MAKYVCPVHDEVVLYPDDKEQDSEIKVANEVRVEPPKYCNKCGKYYYRRECEQK